MISGEEDTFDNIDLAPPLPNYILPDPLVVDQLPAPPAENSNQRRQQLVDDPLRQSASAPDSALESDMEPPRRRPGRRKVSNSSDDEPAKHPPPNRAKSPIKSWDPLLWKRRNNRRPRQDSFSPPPRASANDDELKRQEILGPHWERVLTKIPASRKEALTIMLFMKKRLIRLVTELNFYKDRVTLLQNQLIKQNKKEEELIKLRAAFNEQSLELQKEQSKQSKHSILEKTVRQQEEIITKLEKHLNAKSNAKSGPAEVPRARGPSSQDNGRFGALEQRLMEENETLRHTISELSKQIRDLSRQQEELIEKQNDQFMKYQIRIQEQLLHHQQQNLAAAQHPVPSPPTEVPKSTFTDADKYELYRMLDRAESRIKVLEAQLDMRNRPWPLEKPAQPLEQPPRHSNREPSQRNQNSDPHFWRYSNVANGASNALHLPSLQRHGVTSPSSDPMTRPRPDSNGSSSDPSELWLIQQLQALDVSSAWNNF